MGKLSLIILFLTAVTNSQSQGNTKIDAVALVDITEKADFACLNKLVSSLNYLVLDSSKSSDGSVFYFTKEPKIHGNTLACSTDSKIKIKELTFMTFIQENYQDFKAQLKQIGFKSSGIHKGNTTKMIESEDFEKGKVVVATAIRKYEDGSVVYEFTFLKW